MSLKVMDGSFKTPFKLKSETSDSWTYELAAILISEKTESNWVCVNCAIEMEWLIQYKDLKDKVKYIMEPTHGNQAVHLRYGIDDIQFPYPIQSHRKDPYVPPIPVYSVTT